MKMLKALILVPGFISVLSGISYSSSLEELKSLPYLAWSDKPDTRPSGVIKYNKNKAFDGYNLYTDGVKNVYLMDMAGKMVYRWDLPRVSLSGRWMYVRLLNDGAIVVVSIKNGFMKFDKNSKGVWNAQISTNHDIEILPDGSFLVQDVELPIIYNNRCVVFDSIAHVSKDGKVLDKWSIYAHLKELQKLHFPSLLDRKPKEGINEKSLPQSIDGHLVQWNYPLSNAFVKFGRNFCTVRGQREWYEYYHLNSIQILPDTSLGLKDKRFQKGNWLICFRNVDLVLILDRDTRQVVWSWGPGILDGPHMPRMLNNGNILIFDNGIHRTYSRLLIINPASDKIVWEYKANPPESFYSQFGGAGQLLSNGNFLICESAKGRVFEITPSGEIVWEFLNPDENVNGQRMTIYRMMRVTKQEISGWLRVVK